MARGRQRMIAAEATPSLIDIEADVLIVGGGMAAVWAAIAAARAGAAVVLVDKGFVGTSGVTATGGPNHWWVPPDPALRAEAIERRWRTSFGLAEREWMAHIGSHTNTGDGYLMAAEAGAELCAGTGTSRVRRHDSRLR